MDKFGCRVFSCENPMAISGKKKKKKERELNVVCKLKCTSGSILKGIFKILYLSFSLYIYIYI